MSDVIDIYRAIKERRKAERSLNFIEATDAINKLGLKVWSFNNGQHLRIKHGADKIDFWPSSGLWKVPNRVPPIRRHGLNSLLEFLGAK